MKIDITPDTAGMFRFSIAILGSLTKIPKGEKAIIREMLDVGLRQTQYIKEQNDYIKKQQIDLINLRGR